MAADSLPKPKKRQINLGALWLFAKGHGFTASDGVSPFDQASRALEKAGHPKENRHTYKQHCEAFIGVIEGWSSTSGRKAQRKKKVAAKAKAKKLKYSGPTMQVSRHQQQAAPSFDAANSPDFLSSFEWRRVRMVALKQYGPRCQCCGASPADGAVMNVDHIKPRRFFPQLALTVSNLQILCGPCNHGKGSWDMTDWRPATASA